MRRVTLVAGLAIGAASLGGCASLIGASFDDATLGDGGLDGEAGSLFPDVILSPSDAADADASAPDAGDAYVDPSTLGAVSLWLSSDNGVTANDAGVISAWAPRNGGPPLKAFALFSPLEPATVVPAAQNGLPLVKFVRAKGQYFFSTLTGPKGKELSIFVVGKGDPMALLTWGSSFSASDALFPWGTAKTSMGLYMYGEWFAQSASSDTRFSVWEVVYRTSTLQGASFFFNGVAGDTVTTRLTDLPEVPLVVGGATFGGNPAYFTDGLIGEVLVYSEALTPAKRRRLEAHLAQRWGFLLGP